MNKRNYPGKSIAVLALALVYPARADPPVSQVSAPVTTASPTSQAPAGEAPSDVIRRLSDLVHTGRHAEAQKLTEGLLLAYPDDPRLIKVKALLDKALTATRPGNETVSPAVQHSAPTTPAPLTGMDKVNYNALVEQARQAQQTTDLDEQKPLLRALIQKSFEFALVHPDQNLIWQLIAAAALSLNDPLDGARAGYYLLANGAADSNDQNLQQLLAQLSLHGWLEQRNLNPIKFPGIPDNFPGVIFSDVNPDNRTRYHLPSDLKGVIIAAYGQGQDRGLTNFSGCLISEIDPDSAWARAGFKPGDVVLSLGTSNVNNTGDAVAAAHMSPGAEMRAVVWRDNQIVSHLVQRTPAYLVGKNHTVAFPKGGSLDLIWIAPGSFLMGSPRSEKGRSRDEGPQTTVTVSTGFWLGKTPVTQGQYRGIMGANPSHFPDAGDDAPVEQVSWDDAMAFCRNLTSLERTLGYLPKGYEFTLPTEAHWEYACRAGTTGPRYAEDLSAIAWYRENSAGTTHPVGQKAPNAWGLYDMLGDVLEWCSDWYGPYPGGSVIDPRGPASSAHMRIPRHVDRGSTCVGEEKISRSAHRMQMMMAGPPPLSFFGFRVELSPVRLGL